MPAGRAVASPFYEALPLRQTVRHNAEKAENARPRHKSEEIEQSIAENEHKFPFVCESSREGRMTGQRRPVFFAREALTCHAAGTCMRTVHTLGMAER